VLIARLRSLLLLLPLSVVSVLGCSRSGSSAAPVEWTSGGVRFTQRTVHYASLNLAIEAQPEGTVDALVADEPASDAVLVEIAAEPAHGAGYPWTFETSFGGGAPRQWACSPDGPGRVCRALISVPGVGGPAKTRLASPAPDAAGG
jgi:hypothetical protein